MLGPSSALVGFTVYLAGPRSRSCTLGFKHALATA